MSDRMITIPNCNHDASEISQWCYDTLGVRSEASTAGDRITVHPRPRELSDGEWENLVAVLMASWPFSIAVDRAQIDADGVDTATVAVVTDPLIASIQMLVRDQEVEVELVEGVGTLQLTASAPTLDPQLVVRAVAQATFGHRQVVIEAV